MEQQRAFGSIFLQAGFLEEVLRNLWFLVKRLSFKVPVVFLLTQEIFKVNNLNKYFQIKVNMTLKEVSTLVITLTEFKTKINLYLPC